MKAYLVDLLDPKSQTRQRIWVKTKEPVTRGEMQDYVDKLEGLRVELPLVLSCTEKTLPGSIRQELVEKVFPVFTK
jgi:hypothetical protein